MTTSMITKDARPRSIIACPPRPPLASLVRDVIADFELHRQDPRGGIRSRLGLLLGPGLSHPWSPAESSAVAGNAQCYPSFSGLLVKASGNYPV